MNHRQRAVSYAMVTSWSVRREMSSSVRVEGRGCRGKSVSGPMTVAVRIEMVVESLRDDIASEQLSGGKEEKESLCQGVQV